MARIGDFKRLIREDFGPEDQDLIGKLAFTINPLLESLSSAFNKGITFEDNFNAQVKEVEVMVDASGIPTTSTSFKSILTTPCKGIICVRAENLTNTGTYPTGQPFISFSDNAGQVTIKHVTGLQASNKYRLKLIALA